MESKSGIIHYMDGTTDLIYDEVAVQVKEMIKQDKIHPQGIMNFDNNTIFVMNIKKIEWNF